MDPNDILLLLAGSGGGLAVLGAGVWAWARSRRSGTKPEDGPREDGTGSTATAVKERPETKAPPASEHKRGQTRSESVTTARPAVPTWGDTLTPARPAQAEQPAAEELEQTAVDEPEQPAVEEPEQTAPAPIDPDPIDEVQADESSLEASEPAEDAEAAPKPEVEKAPEQLDAPEAAERAEPVEPAASAEPAAALVEPDGDDQPDPSDAPSGGITTVGSAHVDEHVETADDALAAPGDPAADAPAPGEAVPTAEPTSAADPVAEPEPAPAAEPEAVVEPLPAESAPAPTAVERPESADDRLTRLRSRLAGSGSFGRGLLALLGGGKVDESTWDEVEETLLLADLGPGPTDELMESLRARMRTIGENDPSAVREALREELVKLVDPELDRRIAATRIETENGSVPSVVLMVGVNGTGKTTTVGKLARVLVAADRHVVLGAADTFRAAAAEQLATWGERVGVETVRSEKDGADPASVAFDAVKKGVEDDADVVIVDTAGRLQNKKDLMDQLGKVKRVAEKPLGGAEVAEVLLVLDATTGQNGMQQARVFSEAVHITGLVLTKLDGTAKGGIVVNVQRELGVPVKMVGLGEGMDDLAPFDAYGFVDALLGD